MKKIICILSIIAFIFPFKVFANDDNLKNNSPIITVNLTITAEEMIRDRIFNAIKKELEKNDDIKVAEGRGDWRLDIIASKLIVRSGVIESYIFSMVVLNPPKEYPKIFEGHELITGSLDIQNGTQKVANLFLEKYLHKKIRKSSSY